MFYLWSLNDTLEKVSKKLRISEEKIIKLNKDINFSNINESIIIRIK